VSEALKSPPAPYLQELWAKLEDLRCVVVVGLPGTGKSLLVREIAAAAAAAGRNSSVLQWDVSREGWDSHPAASALFPEIDGVTHSGIRLAMGSWVRAAVGKWFSEHPGHEQLLIVEAPHIGGRFSELSHIFDDEAEKPLAGSETLFVLVAPTKELQLTLKRQRAVDMESEQGTYESNNASPDLLDELTNSLRGPAEKLGITGTTSNGYDPGLYAGLMQHVLRHRHVLLVQPDELMQVSGSVYSLGDSSTRLWATREEVSASLEHVASLAPHELMQRTDSWFRS
jgi:hypothetical protein